MFFWFKDNIASLINFAVSSTLSKLWQLAYYEYLARIIYTQISTNLNFEWNVNIVYPTWTSGAFPLINNSETKQRGVFTNQHKT